MKMKYLFAALVAFSLTFSVSGENWAQWRGPAFNGSSTEKNLPEKWTKESAAWTAPMPGPSASTPVIHGKKLFTSTIDATEKTLHALCLDAETGTVLWKRKIGDGIQRDDRSNFSSPSPVADQERVFFFYGNGTLIAFDHDGKELWQRSITKDYGDFAFQWTFSSSPMLHEGTLYLQVLQRDVPVHGRGKQGGESYILGLDPATGKTRWRHVRPSDAVAESLEAFSTPIPHEHNGRKEILISGGDCLTGHNPKNGAELWRWGTWNPTRIGHWRLVPSPVAGGGVILACAPKGDPVYAIKTGGTGTLTDHALAWKSEPRSEISSDVPTPAFYDGDFFVLSDVKRAISRVVPKTGEVKWTLELPGRKKYEASPTVADGKIYLMNFGGDVVVVDAGEGKVLHTVSMGDSGDDMTRSTIAVANGRLYIRTNNALYCIAKKS